MWSLLQGYLPTFQLVSSGKASFPSSTDALKSQGDFSRRWFPASGPVTRHAPLLGTLCYMQAVASACSFCPPRTMSPSRIGLDKSRNNKPSCFIALFHSPSTFTSFYLINSHNNLWGRCHYPHVTGDEIEAKRDKVLHPVNNHRAQQMTRILMSGPALFPLRRSAHHMLTTALMKPVFYSHCQMVELKLEVVSPKSHGW